MRNTIRIILFLLATCLTAQAETVVLKNGLKYTGTIVFQNEEVLVFKDASGTRFQYMMADVERVEPDEEVVMEEIVVTKQVAKKVSVSVQLLGGGALIPSPRQGGGMLGADMAIGSYQMQGRRIFLGGSIGYRGLLLNGKNYSVVPLRLRAEIPCMQTKHSPLFGLSVGYGFAATQGVTGGLSAGMDLGWKYTSNKGRGVYLGLCTEFQNARLDVTEVVDEQEFTSKTNRNIVGVGLKAAFYL